MTAFTASLLVGFGFTLGAALALVVCLVAFVAAERWLDPQ
jgi:hypothetical protein